MNLIRVILPITDHVIPEILLPRERCAGLSNTKSRLLLKFFNETQEIRFGARSRHDEMHVIGHDDVDSDMPMVVFECLRQRSLPDLDNRFVLEVGGAGRKSVDCERDRDLPFI